MEPARNFDAPSRPAEQPASPALVGRAPPRLRRLAELLILWLHRQADRLDLVPAEFGDETPVDHADAGSVAGEWMRQARLWASYNPEEMLALKAGAVALGAALMGLVILVAAIR